MRKFVVLFTVWFINMNLLAQDFSAINDDGVRIYYNYIVKGYSVEVTCAGYYTYNGRLTIDEAKNGEYIYVYSMDGKYIGSSVVHNGTAEIDIRMHTGNIFIVKIGNMVNKIVLN